MKKKQNKWKHVGDDQNIKDILVSFARVSSMAYDCWYVLPRSRKTKWDALR